jgi:hypothetical protein
MGLQCSYMNKRQGAFFISSGRQRSNNSCNWHQTHVSTYGRSLQRGLGLDPTWMSSSQETGAVESTWQARYQKNPLLQGIALTAHSWPDGTVTANCFRVENCTWLAVLLAQKYHFFNFPSSSLWCCGTSCHGVRISSPLLSPGELIKPSGVGAPPTLVARPNHSLLQTLPRPRR